MLKPARLPSPLELVTSTNAAFAGIVEQTILPHAGDENVREAVVVVIANGHAHAIHFDIQPGMRSYISESAVAVVAIEPQRGAPLLVAGPIHAIDQQNVLPAVAVVIEKGAAGAQSFRQ